MVYDRDTVVRGMQRHYDLLVQFAFLEPSDILRPPSTGWTDEQINMDLFLKAGRSNAVIDLVKHLPYLRRTENPYTRDEWEIHQFCLSINYLRGGDEDSYGAYGTAEAYFHEGIMPFDGLVSPPGMVALATDWRIDTWVLDTDEGVVWDCTGTLEDDEAPDSEPWRQYGRRLEIQEFFDEVTSHLERFWLIPEPGTTTMWGGNSRFGRALKCLLRQHGWPDIRDKKAYVAAVEKYKETGRRKPIKKRVARRRKADAIEQDGEVVTDVTEQDGEAMPDATEQGGEIVNDVPEHDGDVVTPNP